MKVAQVLLQETCPTQVEEGKGVDVTMYLLVSLWYNYSDSCVCNTVFAEIFVVVLILDVTFITKFKKLNNCRGTAACWAP